MSYTNVFGGSAVAPSNPQFLALTIFANQPLVWPLETTEGSPPAVAALMDVTALSAGLDLMMPPGNTGSTGVVALIANVGANSFKVTDTAGNQIAVIAQSQQWLVALTSNATTNGTWVAYQLAATTSSASAASLAGAGLAAAGAQIETSWPTQVFTGNTSIGTAQRANLLVFQGATAATFSLQASATLGSGFVCAISNQGVGNISLNSAAGELINGAASLVIAPGNSGFVFCTIAAGVGSFNSVGPLSENFVTLSVANGLFTVDQLGNVSAQSLTALKSITAGGGQFVVDDTGDISAANITTSGNILTAGNVTSTDGIVSAFFFVGQVVEGLVAAGNAAANAYNFTTQSSGTINVFSTVAAGTGCALSANTPIGASVCVCNQGGNNLLIYPPNNGPGAINGSASVTLNSGGSFSYWFTRIDTQNWIISAANV